MSHCFIIEDGCEVAIGEGCVGKCCKPARHPTADDPIVVGDVWWNRIHKGVKITAVEDGFVHFESDWGLHKCLMTELLFRDSSYRPEQPK